MFLRSLASCAIAAIGFAQPNTGMTASMDIAIIEQAKDVYWDTITSVINNLALPDFYEDKNHYLTGNRFELK